MPGMADMTDMDYETALRHARKGTLPADFVLWDLTGSDETGWTVAHEAAEYGHLPETFDKWHIALRDGWTVAHVAAAYGTLPAGFGQWSLMDNDGWPVAHVAAESGHLPSDFALWDLTSKDHEEITVRDVAECREKRLAELPDPPWVVEPISQAHP